MSAFRSALRVCSAAGGLPWLSWTAHAQSCGPAATSNTTTTTSVITSPSSVTCPVKRTYSSQAAATAPTSVPTAISSGSSVHSSTTAGYSSSSPSDPGRPELQQAPRPPVYRDGHAFKVYTSSSAPSSLQQIVQAASNADVILLGEYHDDPVAHALQLELLKRVVNTYQLHAAAVPSGSAQQANTTSTTSTSRGCDNPPSTATTQQPRPGGGAKPAVAAAPAAGHGGGGAGGQAAPAAAARADSRPVLLSLEMFESDVQLVMDEYLAGQTAERDLLQDARPWPNYLKDYRPLVQHCKSAKCPVICANAPRRYVSAVGRHGAATLQQLPPAAQALLPPIPLLPPSAAYAEKLAHSMSAAREQAEMAAAAAAAAALADAQQQNSHIDAMAAARGLPHDTSNAPPAGGVAARSQPPSGGPAEQAEEGQLARQLQQKSLACCIMSSRGRDTSSSRSRSSSSGIRHNRCPAPAVRWQGQCHRPRMKPRAAVPTLDLASAASS